MDPARALCHARKRAGLSQRELAARAGVPQPTVARIELATVVPRVDTLDRLLRAAEMTLEIEPLAGIGVDQSMIDEQLRLTPDQRATRGVSAVGFIARVDTRGHRIGESPASTDYDPARIVRTLRDHRVRFVLIGGLAAQLLGSPIVTFDVDICYARTDDDLERLAAALRSLGAQLRGAPGGLPFKLDALTLRNGDAFTFTTDAGALDILGMPAGTSGYDALERTAVEVAFDGKPLLVASIDDLLSMKRASGRVKDRVHIEELAALRDRLDERQRENP